MTVKFKIYRSNVPMDIEELPDPIVIDLLDKTYSDANVSEGNTYYYRVGAVRNGIEKVSGEIPITIDSYALLSFIAAGNAGMSDPGTSVNCPIPPHSTGDIIVIIARAGQDMVVSGYEKIFTNSAIKVFAKIATTSQASQTLQNVQMTYGAVASIVLRPNHPVSIIEKSAVFETYTSAAVSNDDIPRVLTTPPVEVSKSKFELNIVTHSGVYASAYAIWANQTAPILAARDKPASVEASFNFVVFGKYTGSGVLANGGSIEVTKIPDASQSIGALTICISAK